MSYLTERAYDLSKARMIRDSKRWVKQNLVCQPFDKDEGYTAFLGHMLARVAEMADPPVPGRTPDEMVRIKELMRDLKYKVMSTAQIDKWAIEVSSMVGYPDGRG